MGSICILSDLEIPHGKQNVEHYCPRSRVPQRIAEHPNNLFPAHKVVNCIKNNLMPCEWEEQKFDLTYHAIYHWNIRHEDKVFLKKTLEHWEEWYRNPCQLCLMECKGKIKG